MKIETLIKSIGGAKVHSAVKLRQQEQAAEKAVATLVASTFLSQKSASSLSGTASIAVGQVVKSQRPLSLIIIREVESQPGLSAKAFGKRIKPPFVKAALPSLEMTFRSLLSNIVSAAITAFAKADSQLREELKVSAALREENISRAKAQEKRLASLRI